MSRTTIDFSAEFGGRDAADAVLPHFKALKAASRGLHFEGFPFPQLAFILRVDGKVNEYGFSGVGELEIDKDGEYLAVDIGVRIADRSHVADVVTSAILASSESITNSNRAQSWDIDIQSLHSCLLDLCARYRDELDVQLTH